MLAVAPRVTGFYRRPHPAMSRARTASSGTTRPIHDKVTKGMGSAGVAKEFPGPAPGRSKWQATSTAAAYQYRFSPAQSASARVSTADNRSESGSGRRLGKRWRTTAGQGTVRFAIVPQREDDIAIRFGILIANHLATWLMRRVF